MAKPSRVPGLHPRTPLSKAAPRLLAARLADLRRHETALDRHAGIETVHDMRVAARRLRAALKLFAKSELSERERGVKRLQDALGEVRDVHVQMQWLRAAQDGHEEGIRSILRRQERQLRTRERKVRKALDEWRKRTAVALAAELGKVGGKGHLGGKKLRRKLEKGLARVERLMKEVGDPPDPRAAHRLRIRVKKLRYAA